ncbi:MAG: hypothetical protein R6W31_03575 [Bacteroidales bacterium]
MKSILFSIPCMFISFMVFKVNAQVLRPEHKACRLEGITNLTMENGVLTFESTNRDQGFLVIESDAPLRLIAARNVIAFLSPGWDGTLGYKMYGLSLSPEKKGRARVTFQVVEPPCQAIPATPGDMKLFKAQLEERPSHFGGEKSDFPSWQEKYRDSLVRTLMGGGFPERVPGDMVIEYEKTYENFRLIAFSYQSQSDRRNTALLSIPEGVEKAPLLVALHGHETTWAIADSAAFREGHIDDFCAYFANRGWAVLQPATMDHHLQHHDWTLQGEWTWDAMTAIDLCTSYPTIHMDQVAVCGLSTGAHLAMNLLALDPRVKAGVVGCILSTWNHYEKRFRIPLHCDCGIAHQLPGVMEQCDWAALAAPKPVQFQHGLQDAAFCPGADESLLDLKWNTGVLPREEYDAMFAEISRAYGMYEKSEQVTTFYHQGPHSVNNEAAYRWLTNIF